MSNSGDFSVSAVQRKRAGEPTAVSTPAPAASASTVAVAVAPAAPAPAAPGFSLPVDPIRLLLAVWRKLWLVLLAGVLFAAPAGAFGWRKFETTFTVTVQLIRRELSNSFRASEMGEAFKPRQLSVATIVSIMRSPSLLAKVGAQAKPRISGGTLMRGLVILQEKNTDLITVTYSSQSTAEATASTINLYAEGVVELTKSLQQQESAELDRFLREQIAHADTELAEVNQELLAFSREAKFYSAERETEAYLRDLSDGESRMMSAKLEQETASFRIAAIERELAKQDPAVLRLAEAREQLKVLLTRYTEANPLVADQRDKIAGLEKEVTSSTNGVADFQPGNNSAANAMFVDLVGLKAQRAGLTNQFLSMAARLQEVQAKLASLPEKTVAYAKMKGRQQALEATRSLLAGRQREAQLFAENSLGYYRLFAPADARDVGVSSKAKKTFIITAAACVFGMALVFLGVCGREALDARIVSPADMRRAAGAPVLARLGDLAAMDTEALARWRFATWSSLFRVLGDPAARAFAVGVTSATAGEGRSTWVRLLAEAAAERDFRTLVVSNAPPAGESENRVSLAEAIAHPAAVIRLLKQKGRATVEQPTDWTWTAERRSRWVEALAQWRTLPRLAVLVEIPPATRLDAVLFSETLPHLLWLSRSGVVEQDEVAPVIKTLRASDARLSGVLANFIPSVFGKLPDLSRFGLALAIGLGFSFNALAKDTNSAPVAGETNGVLFGSSDRPKLAAWQERLTLGPSDILNIWIYGRKDTLRSQVAVGPDGRLNYLQADGVMAAGLTIDELRAELNKRLASQYRNVKVIVTPSEFRSKRYFLLGAVMDRGAYPLEQPTTIMEAIAKARGIATGLLEQNTVEIADLERAFLMRRGRPAPVDFVALFNQGDLSQNIYLEPDDYLYFPSSTLNEVYVLGAVSTPGTMGVSDKSSLLGAITTRGGFTEKAYRSRVLIIRGSVTRPETFVVSVSDILRGKTIDFMLRPKDIIYVADHPWVRVDELLDMAIGSFTSAIVTKLSNRVVPTR